MEVVKSPAEGRVLLRNVSWETYERLMDEREERSVPLFFYDRGDLEITSPSTQHETISQVVALLVQLLAIELDTDVQSTGSTTFKREGLAKGFEPDQSCYLGDAIEIVRGRRSIDLDAGDPSPDLVVEVDLTDPSLDKLPVYARLGVTEVWRFVGGKPEILSLDVTGSAYEASERSVVLPILVSEALINLVEDGLTARRPDWARRVREWARQALER